MKSRMYYEVTEIPYLNLCSSRSGFMNMGIWPASTLVDAQRKLVNTVIDFSEKSGKQGGEKIIELGSG